MERDRDRQLARLAQSLRDEGVPPARDLWPDIDAAITRREQAGRRRSLAPWWRLVAAAAAVAVVAVGLGNLAPHGGGGGAAGPQAVRPTPAAVAAESSGNGPGALATLDQALDDLEAALAVDPENLSLSRLVLMVHRTRSELLRKNLTSGLRAG